MKSILFFFLFSLSFTCIIYSQTEAERILFFYSDDEQPQEVKEYQKRVVQNGGIITNESSFEKQINLLKDNEYLDSLAFWVSSAGGIKKNNDTIVTLFDFKGHDLAVTTKSIGPLLKDNTIHFVGTNSLQNSDFIISQPFTIVLQFRQDTISNEETIFSSLQNNDYSISLNKKSELIIEANKKLKDGVIDAQKNLIIIEFNGDSSRLFLNNNLIQIGKLDNNDLQGILIGKNLKNNPDYFGGYIYTLGIFRSIIPNSLKTKLYTILK